MKHVMSAMMAVSAVHSLESNIITDSEEELTCPTDYIFKICKSYSEENCPTLSEI